MVYLVETLASPDKLFIFSIRKGLTALFLYLKLNLVDQPRLYCRLWRAADMIEPTPRPELIQKLAIGTESLAKNLCGNRLCL
ncbi:hypothetical protein BZ163_04860 [Pseudomonas sp. VI4.1]|nr:hypothetical protein BZ163_04860 [Pseudomonas sp. VI4.1]